MKQPLISLFSLFVPLHVLAGGFQINLLGTRNVGMAHTGTASRFDGSSIFFNPGTVSFLSKRNLYFNFQAVTPRVAYRATSPTETVVENETKLSTPFSFFANWKPKDAKWAIGLGVYTPYGSGLKYPSNWTGRFIVQEISIRTLYIQPTVSYQITEKLGIGVGFVFATGSAFIQKAIPAADLQGQDGQVTLKGNGTGYGFNAGIYFQPTENLSFGISYRSAVKMNLSNGKATFQVPSSLSDQFPNTTFQSSITLPSTISIGTEYKPIDKLTLAFDVNYTTWSSYQQLVFDFTQNTDKLQDSYNIREWQNSFTFRFGAEYRWNDKLATRGGAYYDRTVVKDGYLTPDSPDANRIGFTVGIGYAVNERFRIDTSCLYQTFQRSDYNERIGFGGEFKTVCIVGGIGFQYSF
ncbi:MAG: outer membrane protein transport protein [Bacteroidia bacterium]|nr:outer membrane protein transport protein [Bacteroidia bacterium]